MSFDLFYFVIVFIFEQFAIVSLMCPTGLVCHVNFRLSF